MVSYRKTRKLIPQEIVIPNSRYQLSLTREDVSTRKKNLLESAADKSPVIYDTHINEFVIDINGKRIPVNEGEVYEELTTKIPDYIIQRIEVQVPEGIFPAKISAYNKSKKFFFNRIRKEWMNEYFQYMPSGFQSPLNNYLYEIVESAIKDFSHENNRNFSGERIKELSKLVTNKLLTSNKKR